MTIAAIATANATGGIGIVRLSGEKSIEIANKIFSLDVASFKSHTLHLGKIICNDKIIDEALVSVFKAPNSYTGEDVVEFNCHGGLRVCKMVLEAVYQNGANPAGPGEFTKRAFLNGKMDLSQAEAVADLISAETDDAVTVAANQLDKRLSNNINSLRDELVASTSHILAMIDFSEEGVEELDYTDLKSTLEKINSRSKCKSLGDSTFWGVDEEGLTHQRTPLSPDKIKSASELFHILKDMGIPSKDIPSEKKLDAWLTDCQAATKADKNATPPQLKLNNGTPVKSIWKFGSKGNLDNSPLGWNGIITPTNKFDQLRSLSASNDRLELWLGWNAKKNRWEYYKKLIPTASALAGLKRMGLPWRGTKNAPKYLLDILKKNKATDLHSMICGTLPPHAVKVGQFRKGDVFLLDFELNPKFLEKLQKEKGSVDMINHPKTIRTWGAISAILSEKKLEFKALIHKDRKIKKFSETKALMSLLGKSEHAEILAQQLNLTPPV